MKLLTISHPCVTPINQQFFAEVERQTGWELCLIIPSNWKNEYAQHLVPKRWSQYQGQLQSIPVWQSGNIPLHLYRSHFLRLLRKFQPDVIYVHHEPYALATTQIYIANALSIRKPIGFFTWQNIVKSYPFPFQKMQKFVLNNSHFAVSGSYSAQKGLEEKGYQGKSIVLPGGVDLE
ncbi:MAG: hypothetical protein RI580_10440, partial [Halothece sp. Uz-M2-17]|nr:hypothetical protein [Halothece sp. Uz-M2-17]